MKRKIVTAVIAFILCAAVVPTAGIYSVMAENEDTLQVEDGADYAALSGVWKNEDAQADETLTLSADGLFVYHTGEGDDVQGYLEYVDEYNDGNGRYDMYNRMGMWLEGFYLDSADTLHMGNDGAAVFTRAEEDQAEENSEGQTENEDSVEKQSYEYTEKFTYPVYELEFTTGANEDTCKWKMLYFQTDTNTFAYAYRVSADFAEEMEAEYRDAISSLELTEIEGVENTETTFTQGEDYDPSAEGESLEMFISYFDSWYQYGDLNAMNIRLYGEGTWEIYNSLNSDKTGGYFFDSGTFTTLGTTALKLVNDSGIYVTDVTLDGDGDLMLSPVISGYGNIYAGAAFLRESDSIAYEAQTADDGEGYGDYIPDEDYVEESDPGDTYYWYDGEGNVMYFDGSDSYYIGPDDVFYIDEAGRLMEY